MHNKDGTDQEEGTGQATEADSSDSVKAGPRFLIRLPARHNPRLQAIIDRVNADDELYALWQAANMNAVKRRGMSDHGPVHVQIVANIALKLLRLLVDKGVQPRFIDIRAYHQFIGFFYGLFTHFGHTRPPGQDFVFDLFELRSLAVI